MNEDRLVVESARRILRDWLEAKGIEVEESVPKKKAHRQLTEKLAFKLEVQFSPSVLSELKSELDFRNAVSDTRESFNKWQKDHPAATSEEILDWRNNFITWGAENYHVDKEELMLAIEPIDAKEAEESKIENVSTDKTMQAAAGE